MALIAATTPRGKVGEFEVLTTALTGADTLTYKPSVFQVLNLRNADDAPVTVVIDGSLVTTVALPGQGRPINNAAGYSVVIAPGQTQAIVLNTIANFLAGVVNVTGGTADVTAWIVEG